VKRFKFRLEQVLRVRRIQEDQARAELLTANRAAHLAAMHVEERLAAYEARERPAGSQPIEAFERTLFLLDTAAASVGVARATHREAIATVATRRAHWADAQRRVAALERLEGRRREEHIFEMRRAEDQLVDDLVVARHSRGESR
jgi:flagellar export protein FliJ